MSNSQLNLATLATESCSCCDAIFQKGGWVMGADCTCDYWFVLAEACPICQHCYEHCDCQEEDRRGAVVRQAWINYIWQTQGAAAKRKHLLPYIVLSDWDRAADQAIYEAVLADVLQQQAVSTKLNALESKTEQEGV